MSWKLLTLHILYVVCEILCKFCDIITLFNKDLNWSCEKNRVRPICPICCRKSIERKWKSIVLIFYSCGCDSCYLYHTNCMLFECEFNPNWMCKEMFRFHQKNIKKLSCISDILSYKNVIIWFYGYESDFIDWNWKTSIIII